MLSDMRAQRDDMREQRDAWQRQAEARAGVVVEMASDAHANATVEVDPIWEQLGEQKLRRAAKVIFRETAEYLPLDFTIEGITIFYHDRRSCLLLCIFFQYPSVVIGDVRSSNSFMRLL